jgi:5'-3' exonuclease
LGLYTVMGIPSYFSYIIRKHPYIITRLQQADNLYLDSNSIIYDMVSSLEVCTEEILAKAVCEKIDYYLNLVNPKRVIVAFDGIPPMAKIKQQRERRYKSWIMPSKSGGWNTLQITPGTSFMTYLDRVLNKHFANYTTKYDYFQLSTSVESGEGEHKIFTHIRDHPEAHISQRTLVYGLDSDLIVLGLNHLIYGEIRLLREAPAFMLDDRELHVLDLPKLAEGICEVIGPTKLPDYILMTLLLGNDFMPHFPALNLRTTGFDTLLKTYTSCMSPTDHLFDQEINWDQVTKFFKQLSVREHSIIAKEYHARNRLRVDTSTEEKKAMNLPILQREVEHGICPIQNGWEKRYYKALFKDEKIETICKNYTDMLQWNMQYYTKGCMDWTLQYHYMYPPLLVDLVQHLPSQTVHTYNQTKLTSPELLRYVLPPIYHNYIPNGCSQESLKPKLVWAYCRYSWESHVDFHCQ